MKENFDCIVIGYGPVGALLSIFLSKLGLRVAVIDKNLDIIDVDTVLESQLNKKYKKSNEDSKSAQTILSGDYDCEETAGNVEAIFTLIFFLSFVIYLIYMFAIIP